MSKACPIDPLRIHVAVIIVNPQSSSLSLDENILSFSAHLGETDVFSVNIPLESETSISENMLLQSAKGLSGAFRAARRNVPDLGYDKYQLTNGTVPKIFGDKNSSESTIGLSEDLLQTFENGFRVFIGLIPRSDQLMRKAA